MRHIRPRAEPNLEHHPSRLRYQPRAERPYWRRITQPIDESRVYAICV